MQTICVFDWKLECPLVEKKVKLVEPFTWSVSFSCHAKYNLWAQRGWCFIIFIVFNYLVWVLRTDTEWIVLFSVWRWDANFAMLHECQTFNRICWLTGQGLQIVGMLETKSSSPCTSVNQRSTEFSSTGANPADNLTSLLPASALTVNQEAESRPTFRHVTAGKAPVGIKIKRWLNSI